MEEKATPGVLVIYTGGTVGSKPSGPDPDSPQIVVPWPELYAGMPEIDRLPYEVACYDGIPPLDSCNVGPVQWKAMAEAIANNYEGYSGFVILHGTDTMVYTGCALSYMLQNLAKPVILTGAQRSALVSTRNDATQNLLSALEIANPSFNNLPSVPEVCIFFGGKLLRANRTIKEDTVGYVAYDSPNVAPLGIAGDRIFINEKLIRPLPDPNQRFYIRTSLDTRVFPIFISPGIQDTTIVQEQLKTEGVRAVIVESFGSGNIPTTNDDFLQSFKAIHDQGVLVANVSQCQRGPVELGTYETSATLLELGFTAASDITVEAALVKLMWLLGDPDIQGKRIESHADIQDVEEAFQRNLAGEQSVSLYVTRFQDGGEQQLGGDSTRYRIPGALTQSRWSNPHIDRAILRLRTAQVSGGAESRADNEQSAVEIRVFMNLDPDASPDEADPSFMGSFKKWPAESSGVLFFDVTQAFRQTARPGDRVSFTLFLDTKDARLIWSSSELAVFVKEEVDS